MTENREIPNEQSQIEEPVVVEQKLTKSEINEKIKFYWKEAETVEGYDKYAEAWKQLNYYRDLKQELYK